VDKLLLKVASCRLRVVVWADYLVWGVVDMVITLKTNDETVLNSFHCSAFF
jgi:hypothetical protein